MEVLDSLVSNISLFQSDILTKFCDITILHFVTSLEMRFFGAHLCLGKGARKVKYNIPYNTSASAIIICVF